MHNFFFFSAMDYYIFLSVALSYKMSIFIISIILLFDLSLKVCLKKSLQCILHQMQQVHHHHFLSICLLRPPPFEHQHYHPESEELFDLSFVYLRLKKIILDAFLILFCAEKFLWISLCLFSYHKSEHLERIKNIL